MVSGGGIFVGDGTWATRRERWWKGWRESTLDKWRWGEENTYSVKKAYSLIAQSMEKPEWNPMKKDLLRYLWKAFAPYKQQVLAWRALCDRLPTRDNLHRRKILDDEAIVCPCCDSETKTLGHLMIHCDRVEQLWVRVVRWVGVDWAAPREIGDHLACFSNLLNGKKVRRKLAGLWICVSWVVWR